MGVGKTTVGRSLAKKLNYTFYDTDDLIIDKFNIQDGDLLGFFEDRKEYLNEERIANVKSCVKEWKDCPNHSFKWKRFTGITNVTGMIETT